MRTKRNEKIDLKNQADSLCYQSEKQISELDDKISEDEKSKLTTLISNLRESIEKEEIEAIKTKTEELQTAMMNLGSTMYNDAAPDDAKTGEENNETNDNVIDTDFTETK
jgi:molecular chaperone DnaK